MRRLLLASLVLFFTQNSKAQCPTIVTDAAVLCPFGPAQNVTIDISEDALGCFDNGQNSYAETIVIDIDNPALFQFVPGTEVLDPGTGDINDGGAPFISAINASQITIGGLGTNNGGGGSNAFDQITLSVDVVATGTGNGNIRRNGGSFLINGAANPPTATSLVTLASDQMTYVSTTDPIQNVANISQNTANGEVLQVPIEVAGSGCPFTMESFDLNYTGTDVNNDITAVKIYYSGNNPVFNPSTDILFGSANSPGITMTINGSQDLVSGVNYFWVVVDVPFTATPGNQVDLDLMQYQYDDNGGMVIRSDGLDYNGVPAGVRNITAFTGTVFTVGNSRMFTTLQAAYDAVPNNMADNYIIELYNDYNDGLETFPVSFAQKTGYNGFEILIRPAAGQSNIRIGGNPGPSLPLIEFNGADYVTMDGRPASTGTSREFRVVNFNNGGNAFAVFQFTNGATYNKLDYLEIEGEAETSLTGLIDFEFAGGGSGNSFNTISNNYITDIQVGGSAKTPGVAIYSLGTGANPNISNTIEGNEIVDIWDGANFDSWCIQLSTGTDSWNIYGNHFYQTLNYGACDFNSGFIQVGDGGGYDIIGNYFGGQALSAGGSPFVISSGLAPFDAIYFLATSGGSENRYAGNTITNFRYTTQTTLNFPAVTFLYNEGSSDFTIGTPDAPNYFGDQATAGAVRLVNNAASGSTGISGITNNGSGYMALNHNFFGSILVDGSRNGATTILVDNLSGDMSIDQCTFGGTDASSLSIASDSRFEMVSNSSSSGLDVSNSIFRNVEHAAGSEPLYGIYNLDGILNVDGNNFYSLTSLGNVEHRIIDHLGTSAAITNNNFETIIAASNGTSSALVGIYANSNSQVTVTDNIYGNTTLGNISINGDDASYGIYKAGNGSFICERNTIQGMRMNNGGANARFYGIYNTGGPMTADDNTVTNGYILSTSGLTAFYGIYCSASGADHVISDNVVESVEVDNGVSVLSTSIEGIYVSANSSTIERNMVRGLENTAATGTAFIRGIHNAFGPSVIRNNVALLENSGTVNSVTLVGIEDADNTGTVRVFHNTVSIEGTGVGGSMSTCYNRNGDATDQVVNNIFQNNRTGGSGPHYTMLIPSIAGTWNGDNNFLENIDNSALINWGGTDYDLPTFQGVSGTNGASQVGTEILDVDGKATAGFAMADGGADLFTPTLVVDDKEENARDTAPWPGAYEGASVSVNNYYVNDIFDGSEIYTTAAGNDVVGCGTVANPCATVKYVVDNNALEASDTVFIDVGYYTNEANIDVAPGDTAVFQGAGNTQTIFDGTAFGANGRWMFITVPGVVVNDLTISNYNSASLPNDDGGGIRIQNIDGTARLNHVKFVGNSAPDGGAMRLRQNGIAADSWVYLDSCTFLNNNVSNSGGAIFADKEMGNVNLIIDKCVFGSTGNGNTADYGGAIFYEGDSVYVDSSSFTDNIATQGGDAGGAILFDASTDGYVSNSTFDNNTSNGNGGAIVAKGGTNITLMSSYFFRNNCDNDGSAIYLEEVGFIINCVVAKNNTNDRGAVVMDGGTTLNIINSTIVDNTGAEKQGLLLRNGGFINVNNSVIYGHADRDITEDAGTINVIYSDYSSSNHGGIDNNNLNVNPGFNNPALDDYSLGASSQVIDKGQAAGAPSVDIIGTSRPQNSGIDMGAYEYSGAICDTAAVASVHTWTGAVSNDWFDCANWDTGTLPCGQCDVIIPGGTPNEPRITGQSAYCNTIQINVPGGALLTLDTPGGGTLEIDP